MTDTKTMIITVPQTVIAFWDYKADLPEGNWEFESAYDFKATFIEVDTGETIEVPLEDTGVVDYYADEPNEWSGAEEAP